MKKPLQSQISIYKNICLIFLLVFVNDNLKAQKTWNKAYKDVGIWSVKQSRDNGFVAVGNNITDDAFIIKTDSIGKLMWEKTYGGPQFDVATCIVQTVEGGYCMTGCTASFGAGDTDIWVVKVDSIGNIQWQYIYGSPSGELGFSIIQTTDGGFAVSGITQGFGVQNTDSWILKLNSLGQVQWQKSYGGPDAEFAMEIIQTQDGGYLAGGFALASNTDYWVVKLDSNGNIIWQNKYGGNGYDVIFSLVQAKNKDYILSGWTTSFADSSYWLLCLDTIGNIKWQKTFGADVGWNGGWNPTHNLIQSDDGGFAFAGWTRQSPNLYWLAKIDSIGIVQWQKTYGISNHFNYTIIQTNDGGYLSGGDAVKLGQPYGWLIKIDKNGDGIDCSQDDSTASQNTSVIPVATAISGINTSCVPVASSATVVNIADVPITYCCDPMNPQFLVSDSSFCIEQISCINFFDHSSGFPTIWKWYFPGANPDSSTLQNPTSICYSQQGTYSVTLIVKNDCTSDTLSLSDWIHVESCPDTCEINLQIPNIFTPNGDSKNDTYHINNLCSFDDFKIIIYSRWGNIVYQSNDYNFQWDGKINGKNCSDGVYYYIIKGKKNNYHGHIQLIRG